MTRPAIYARVSDEDQSLESQKYDINQWLESHPLVNVKWYEDHGKTGRNLARPALQQLREDVRKGLIDTVVVQRLDRLSRTTLDGLTLLSEWAEAGVRIVSIKQQIDLSGPTGKLVASILLAVGEMELELRRERQRAGIQVARERGIYKGRKPGTYKSSPKRALDMHLRGFTIAEIAKALGVSKTTVTKYVEYMECNTSSLSSTQPETEPSPSSPA